MVDFRVATHDDVRFIFAMVNYAICYTPEYSEEVKKKELTHCTMEYIENIVDDELCMVAVDDKEIQGVCFGERDQGTVWLSWIIVKSEYRRTGIGLKLLTRFKHYTKMNGHKVWCSVLTTNVTSNRMFMQGSFTQVCTLKKHWHGLDFNIWELIF